MKFTLKDYQDEAVLDVLGNLRRLDGDGAKIGIATHFR